MVPVECSGTDLIDESIMVPMECGDTDLFDKSILVNLFKANLITYVFAVLPLGHMLP